MELNPIPTAMKQHGRGQRPGRRAGTIDVELQLHAAGRQVRDVRGHLGSGCEVRGKRGGVFRRSLRKHGRGWKQEECAACESQDHGSRHESSSLSGVAGQIAAARQPITASECMLTSPRSDRSCANI